MQFGYCFGLLVFRLFFCSNIPRPAAGYYVLEFRECSRVRKSKEKFRQLSELIYYKMLQGLSNALASSCRQSYGPGYPALSFRALLIIRMKWGT